MKLFYAGWETKASNAVLSRVARRAIEIVPLNELFSEPLPAALNGKKRCEEKPFDGYVSAFRVLNHFNSVLQYEAMTRYVIYTDHLMQGPYGLVLDGTARSGRSACVVTLPPEEGGLREKWAARTSAHELGHTLGLGHHKEKKCSMKNLGETEDFCGDCVRVLRDYKDGIESEY